jgi:hypothetical protein
MTSGSPRRRQLATLMALAPAARAAALRILQGDLAA